MSEWIESGADYSLTQALMDAIIRPLRTINEPHSRTRLSSRGRHLEATGLDQGVFFGASDGRWRSIKDDIEVVESELAE